MPAPSRTKRTAIRVSFVRRSGFGRRAGARGGARRVRLADRLANSLALHVVGDILAGDPAASAGPDDGRGIDLEALGARARTLGVVGAAQLSRMNAAEQADLAFWAGVTTATQLTTLSGRGIGLDVVTHAIAELGGAVAVTTAPGEGTIFDVSVPLGADSAPALSRRIAAAPQAA